MEGSGMLERAVLHGDLTHIPAELERSRVQIFLCADPVESERERRALRNRVYPKLREYCRQVHGLEFQVVDTYDGIQYEEYYSPRVQKIRKQLLGGCLDQSVGPCFVALIGEEYGQFSLPWEIDGEEFEKILVAAHENRINTKALEKWYLRDENGVPPVYHLPEKDEGLPYSSTTVTTARTGNL
ncbi:NACHT and WD repeat domain-containing protein 2-like [Xenopus laevis]|uniref:NACHT and WD repeat domain-containing protein 2-like n=1 Tax=Xenopus laevis TaxID=8355 RepID=A0A8J1MAN1_XENLA|nr:NACHT and WD repeat domain-containing protein 2-like [Xenopus laevis]